MLASQPLCERRNSTASRQRRIRPEVGAGIAESIPGVSVGSHDVMIATRGVDPGAAGGSVYLT